MELSANPNPTKTTDLSFHHFQLVKVNHNHIALQLKLFECIA